MPFVVNVSLCNILVDRSIAQVQTLTFFTHQAIISGEQRERLLSKAYLMISYLSIIGIPSWQD